jgi:hypothetical protein
MSLQHTVLTEFTHNGYRLRITSVGGAFSAEIVDTLGRHARDRVNCIDVTTGAALHGLLGKLERPRGLGILWREDAIEVVNAYHREVRRRRGW